MKADVFEANSFASLAAPGREKARDRVLTIAELHAIWTASAEFDAVQQDFVRFLLLTLQRREERQASLSSASGTAW